MHLPLNVRILTSDALLALVQPEPLLRSMSGSGEMMRQRLRMVTGSDEDTAPVGPKPSHCKNRAEPREFPTHGPTEVHETREEKAKACIYVPDTIYITSHEVQPIEPPKCTWYHSSAQNKGHITMGPHSADTTST